MDKLLPYEIMAVSVAGLGLLLCEWKKSRRNDIIFMVVTTLAMILMASLRAGSVGVDYKVYQDYFQTVCQNNFGFLFTDANLYRVEVGYSVLNFVISRFTSDTRIFMAAVAVLTIGLRAIAIYRYSSSRWISVYVYVTFGFFTYALCTLRQEIAISILLFAIPALQNRKPIPYALIVVLAATFHKSVLILLPVYFIAHLALNWKTLTFYGSCTLFALLFSWPIIKFVTKYVYTYYAPGQAGDYYLDGRDFNTALIPLVLFLAAVLLRKRILERDPRNIVLLNFICYSAVLFTLTLKHFVFQRIALIFLPAALFLIPEIINSVAASGSAYESKLSALKSTDKNRKKQMTEEYSALKKGLRESKQAYRTSLGLTLVGGFLYLLFLLNANRLLLVPYITFLQ